MFIFCSSSGLVDVAPPKTYDPIRQGDRVFFQERTKDLNEGLLYTDFSTESLLQADAIDLLRPLSPLSASRLSALDSAGVAVGSLSDLVASIPSNIE